jgi:hypothetical protein
MKDPKDNRRSRRRDVNYSVWLRYDPALPPIVCMMSDVSDTGARLDVVDETPLPDEFILQLSRTGKPFRRCHVVWRRRSEIGVRFAL